MDVGLHQPGQENETRTVDDAFSVRPSDRPTVRPLFHSRDLPRLNPHIRVEDAAPRIHRHDAGAGEHQRARGGGGRAHAYVVTRGRALVVSWGRSKYAATSSASSSSAYVPVRMRSGLPGSTSRYPKG